MKPIPLTLRCALLAVCAAAWLAGAQAAPVAPDAANAAADEQPERGAAPSDDPAADTADDDDEAIAADDGEQGGDYEVVDDEDAASDDDDTSDGDESDAEETGGADATVLVDGGLRAPPALPVLQKRTRAPGAGSPPAITGAGGGASAAPGAQVGAAGQPPAKPAALASRSFGGVPVRDGATPWQAQLYAPFPAERWKPENRVGREPWEMQHYCGGALIARDWVLTAAHCVYPDMVKVGFRIRVGTDDIARGEGTSFPIQQIVIHPGWDHDKSIYRDDLALIRIDAAHPQVVGRSLPYAEIPLHRGPPPADGAPVTGIGWGKTRDVSLDKPSALLMRVDLAALSEQRCAALPDYGPQKIHANVFCATAPGRQTCRGDSGGPIVYTNGRPVLIGVVSWGKSRCTGDGQPSVFTRVGAYTSWIDGVIRTAAR